jgi:hypothetical protein
VSAGALVGLVSAPPHIGAWVLLVAVAYSAGIALLAAVRTGTYPLAWFAEVLLAAGWGERAGLAALLEDAAARLVLREVKGGYKLPPRAWTTRSPTPTMTTTSSTNEVFTQELGEEPGEEPEEPAVHEP